MKRDVFDSFLAWKAKTGRKPLVLMGARQVGKTWLMRDFGKRNFARVHEFNFDGSADLASVFVNTKKPDDLLRKLSIVGGVKIDPAADLVIFDEIQECADALNSLNPTFHVRKQNPSGCWGFACRSSLHSRFRRVGSFA